MFLFADDNTPRPTLAQRLREEESTCGILGYLPYRTKDGYRSNRVKTINGIPYQSCGGGRRRLATKSSY